MKKYERFITTSFILGLGNTAAICFYSGGFKKAAKIKILSVETFPVAEGAMSQSGRCRCSGKQFFLKIAQKFTEKHLCLMAWWSLLLICLRPETLLKRDMSSTCIFL